MIIVSELIGNRIPGRRDDETIVLDKQLRRSTPVNRNPTEASFPLESHPLTIRRPDGECANGHKLSCATLEIDQVYPFVAEV